MKQLNTLRACKICGEFPLERYVFREMMFGLRNEFEYYECSSCSCLQIGEIPQDIAKYYPPYYYSFNLEIEKLKRQPLIKRLFKDLRIKRKYKKGQDALLKYFYPIQTPFDSKILDIGCGKGALICQLFNKGFEHVSGVDKFIPNEIEYGYGVKVSKKDLAEFGNQSYDLLMMHHVFEHMDNPYDELRDCYRILKPKSYLIIRIPLKRAAWEIYKKDWVQLDAPRHFFIHSLESINILAEKTGFEIRDVIFDSTSFQFWGSELYKKDISLSKTTSELFKPTDMFTQNQIDLWEAEAKRLNDIGEGDQAIFYLYKH